MDTNKLYINFLWIFTLLALVLGITIGLNLHGYALRRTEISQRVAYPLVGGDFSQVYKLASIDAAKMLMRTYATQMAELVKQGVLSREELKLLITQMAKTLAERLAKLGIISSQQITPTQEILADEALAASAVNLGEANLAR